MQRIHSPNVTTLTQFDLDDWKKKVESFPLEIEAKLKILDKYSEIANNLSKKIRDLKKNHIAPIEAKINAITARIEVLTLPEKMQQNEREIEKNNQEFDKINDEHKRVNTTIGVFDSRLAAFKRLKEVLLNKNEHDELKKKITKLEEELQNTLRKSNHVLETLNLKKQELVNKEQRYQSYLQTNGYTSSQSQSNQYYSSQNATSSQSGYKSNRNLVENFPQEDKCAVLSQIEISLLKSDIAKLAAVQSGWNSQSKSELSQLQKHTSRLREIDRDLRLCSPEENYNAAKTSLYELDQNIMKEERDLLPHRQKLDELGQKLIRLQETITKKRKSQETMEQSLKKYSQECGEYSENTDLNDLNSKLLEQENLKVPYADEASKIYASQFENDNRSTNLQREKLQLELNLQKLKENHFLSTYWNAPDKLFETTKQKTLSAIKKFNETSAADQSYKTRAALVDLEEKIEIIRSSDATKGNPDAERLAYQQLCGFLLDLTDYAENSALTNTILDIISYPQTAELSYELEHSEVKQQFQLLLSTQPKLGIAGPERLKESEEKAYNTAYSKLHDALNALPKQEKNVTKLIQAGNVMLAEFDKNRAAPHKPGEEFDLKFHTTILNKANEWLLHPNSPQLQTEFKTLLKANTNGQPSLGKKIGGACIIFAGALLVAASAVATFVSLGIAAPITFTGMGVGIGLIGSGATLFALSCQRGEQKKMQKFKEYVEKKAESDLRPSR